MLDIIKLGGKILDKVIPNVAERDKAKAQLRQLQQQGELKEIESIATVLMGEINGESWLQRNWRPVTMLTFAGLIVAKWLGLTAPGISEAVELQLFGIIKVGIGGYIFSRGGEKMLKTWAETKK